MKKKFLILIAAFYLIAASALAKSHYQEPEKNDYLYSDAYFDYIIEQASIERMEQIEAQKRKAREEAKKKEIETAEIEEVEAVIEEETPEVITFDEPAFKLAISEEVMCPKYKESFKKVDTKTTIALNDKFGFYHDLSKARNKYNSTDYKILSGAEFDITKYFNIVTGLETNYRGVDQNPQSRKLYFTPTLHLSDIISLSFVNKYNPNNRSSDHDLSIKVSPFKSKIMDFGVYSSITRYEVGTHSESVSFSTNFYLK